MHYVHYKLHITPIFLHMGLNWQQVKKSNHVLVKMHAPCIILLSVLLVLLPLGTLEPCTHTDNGTDGAKKSPDESLFQVEPAARNNGKRDKKERSEKAHEMNVK